MDEEIVGVENGWFSESEVMWPGQKFSLQVKKELYHEKSKFQDILVFESEKYGRVLVLDGVIQLTERDECAYQEMITHLPLFAHRNPQRVLIVGGGDGGVLREVTKHECVQLIDMCEIDATVVKIAREYFGESTATAFDDPRLTLVHDDAAEYLAVLAHGEVKHDGTAAELAKKRRDENFPGYDCIIVDSSDPVGPAQTLFEPQFYEAMRAVLTPGTGVICAQGECLWLHLDLISSVLTACSDIFPSVAYSYTSVPTYPCGQIGFIIATLRPGGCNAIAKPLRFPTSQMLKSLKYYSSSMHTASFVLPHFAATALEQFANSPTFTSSS
mmetsp:Transcript_7600/g.10569  ORF Transcript_7600/g.10569 Transcript_7600/m.10569 type:complete len:328 (-) Transcript_7600:628-1611(-)|eukprot:CAMPEP_0197292378 /NCGR_PEP_ID=MMETSP0890-20130614/22790_1 /TAXON_ID=44058 ORGANISM="Aureoumbra lagunensis, Strain CCMP1510" /NCGR_SAMPLE_ID=MMETSP0890 /ASSEMBLY_ACC=CAM_ASM_000533 /LENGTH=327 /DNA_ID=CAMNT_0042766207 /DNA_START=26 /DNA_END=1009 /DNA_ORIENTATION=+